MGILSDKCVRTRLSVTRTGKSSLPSNTSSPSPSLSKSQSSPPRGRLLTFPFPLTFNAALMPDKSPSPISRSFCAPSQPICFVRGIFRSMNALRAARNSAERGEPEEAERRVRCKCGTKYLL